MELKSLNEPLMETTEWIESLIQSTDDGQRYVLREDITDLLIEETGLLVGETVTQDWNNGLISDWIASEYADVFALTDDLPPETIEGMDYNCSWSEETQEKMEAYEQQNPTDPMGRRTTSTGAYLTGMGEKSLPSQTLTGMPASTGIIARKQSTSSSKINTT